MTDDEKCALEMLQKSLVESWEREETPAFNI